MPDTKTSRISIRLTKGQYSELGKIAENKGTDISTVLRGAIDSYISNESSTVKIEIKLPKEYKEDLAGLLRTFFKEKGIEDSANLNSGTDIDIRK